jgi:hypothetical protein
MWRRLLFGPGTFVAPDVLRTPPTMFSYLHNSFKKIKNFVFKKHQFFGADKLSWDQN